MYKLKLKDFFLIVRGHKVEINDDDLAAIKKMFVGSHWVNVQNTNRVQLGICSWS